MNGREVYKFASRVLPRAFNEAVAKAGVETESVDLLIPHQANTRIIDSARDSLGLENGTVYVNVDRYGNTSAASIPVALYEAIEEGRLKPGLAAGPGGLRRGTHLGVRDLEVAGVSDGWPSGRLAGEEGEEAGAQDQQPHQGRAQGGDQDAGRGGVLRPAHQRFLPRVQGIGQ